MPVQNDSPQSTIAQMIDRIVRFGSITRVDENYFLHALVAETPLSQQEQSQARNVFDQDGALAGC
ncbi:hypothetical protein [Stenomitos frigidus]|uniref:Uncharacterized protein n=1 Tax=Stenomitos frigidus ULC18 TaxID=2107698 RepID=A0A2T1DX53_9CYAN|nr:hypothetical protein [Stenomitos frigidus]PSB25052.1 hypothetical protein C7B82_24580 [Stenomitos frigidus ULC18]